jgi:hypothetical protein
MMKLELLKLKMKEMLSTEGLFGISDTSRLFGTVFSLSWGEIYLALNQLDVCDERR